MKLLKFSIFYEVPASHTNHNLIRYRRGEFSHKRDRYVSRIIVQRHCIFRIITQSFARSIGRS